MSSLLQVVVVLTTLTFISGAEVGIKMSAQKFLTNLIKAFDLNKDGLVSEFELAAGLTSQDANGNGKIDTEEFINYLKNHSPDFVRKADYLFTLFDTDESGFIDLTDAVNIMSIIDGNGDGTIDDTEFQSFEKLIAI